MYYCRKCMLAAWGLFCLFAGIAQKPFDCNGRIFRVLEEQGGSTFQEILIDQQTEEAAFIDLQFFNSAKINGIAYRTSDNLIYGILLEQPYVLCRIDADYRLERLAELPLPGSLLFVSGDISPDGRFLVLLGFSPEEDNNLIALVDLESPGYNTSILPLVKANGAEKVYCADIAFHPTSNKLFGFEHSEGRLITIDIDNLRIDNTTFPVTDVMKGNVPTLFFDAFGRLFGIGSEDEFFSNRNLYHFNVEDGSVRQIQKLDFERNQDGCSCPFKVELWNKVSHRRAFPCTVLQFEFTLVNRTDKVQSDVVFTDTFPRGSRIVHLSELPFKGTVVPGLQPNILRIENIDLPVGIHQFSLKLDIEKNVVRQIVRNRAYLDGILLHSLTEKERIGSDDPETDKADDPTIFRINQLEVDFAQDQVILCPGDTVELDPGIPEAETYSWSTGESTSTITVNRPGYYSVTVSTGCNTAEGRVFVRQEKLSVELGKERTIERGEQVELFPRVSSDAPVNFYFWEASSPDFMSCKTCEVTTIRPQEDTDYRITVANDLGCKATDLLRIKVKEFSLYTPTAFSPDGDGINDRFLLYGRLDYPIASFQIFNRWGGKVFELREGVTNDPSYSWDGQFGRRDAPSGVYVWLAKVVNRNGETEVLKGEVTLVR